MNFCPLSFAMAIPLARPSPELGVCQNQVDVALIYDAPRKAVN